MSNRIITFLALTACLPGHVAKADFRLQAAVSASAGPPASGNAGPETLIAPVIPAMGDAALAPIVKPKVRYARGFGHAVPLSFAARQIVPRNVTIQFGADVDQSLPVDWTGGRSWKLVMGAAVKPLHLHLTFSATSILIS